MILSGGWIAWSHAQAARKRENVEAASEALGEAEQLRQTALANPLEDETHWQSAFAALRRAESRLESVGNERLRERVAALSIRIRVQAAAASKDRRLAADLYKATLPVSVVELRRQQPATPTTDDETQQRQDVGFAPQSRDPRGERTPRSREFQTTGLAPPYSRQRALRNYATFRDRFLAALTRYGINPRTMSPDAAVARVAVRPQAVRTELIAGMHRWLGKMITAAVADRENAAWVSQFLNGIDNHPERVTIRKWIRQGERQLLPLAIEQSDLTHHPPSFICLIASQMHDRNAATEFLRRARNHHPASLEINLQLAYDYHHLRRPEDSIAAFMAALAIRQDAYHCVRLAHVLADSGRVEEALAMCREAIRMNPIESHGYPLLARTLLFAGRTSEAIAAVENGLKTLPEGSQQIQLLKQTLGSAYEATGDAANALEVFQELIDTPGVPPAAKTHLRQRMRAIIERLTADQ